MDYTRTSNILCLFHIFYFYNTVSLNDIREYIPENEISKKTIFRYIRFLEDAGLIRLYYSHIEKAYLPVDSNFVPKSGVFYPAKLPDKKPQRSYMEKIIRLCTLMIQVMDWESWGEDDPIAWYREKYPELSDRTRQRDFKQLREIGYCITYSPANENTPAEYRYTYPYAEDLLLWQDTKRL